MSNESKVKQLDNANNMALRNPDKPIFHRQTITAIRDIAAESFAPPMFHRTKGEALRQFQELVNHPDSMIGKHPEDFCLFEIGQYCTHDGILYPNEVPIKLGMAYEYKEQPQGGAPSMQN